jgi:hypothetical protein
MTMFLVLGIVVATAMAGLGCALVSLSDAEEDET